MVWKMIVTVVLSVISFLMYGVGAFTQVWIVDGSQTRGMFPWHSGDSGWIILASIDIILGFLSFFLMFLFLIAAVLEYCKTGYSNATRDLMFAHQQSCNLIVLFVMFALGTLGRSFNSYELVG